MPHTEHYIDGVWYPSVTTILGDRPKPWLDRWYEDNPVWAPRKTACANAIGTTFHEMAEGLVLNRDVDLTGNIRIDTMAQRFLDWYDEARPVITQTELHVVSKEHQYAGTLDAVGTLPGVKGLVLFDWKTSAGIYPDMELQLAAYAQAYKEQTGIEIKKGVIVLVSKDKPHHRLIVKKYGLGKRPRKAFLKRLEDFRKYSIKRKPNDGVCASV